MTETELANIISRIQKLHAKAESAKEIGSLAEAEAFSAAVSKMLLKYKLEVSVLEAAGQAEEAVDRQDIDWSEFGLYGKRVNWIEMLAMTIARAHFCRIIVRYGSSRIVLVGKESDRKVAEYLITFLARTARRLADEENKREKMRMKKLTGSFATAGFRKSYLAGFVAGIAQRLKETRAEVIRENGGMALVIQKSDEALEAFMRQLRLSKVKAVTTQSTNSKAFHAGKSAAGQVQLTAPISGSTSAPRALTSGR